MSSQMETHLIASAKLFSHQFSLIVIKQKTDSESGSADKLKFSTSSLFCQTCAAACYWTLTLDGADVLYIKLHTLCTVEYTEQKHNVSL